MTNFSFSHHKPIKTNEKKTTIWGKIWAAINLISLVGDMIMPKGAKDNMPVKARNIIILVFIVLLAYLIGSGIYLNALWIIQQVKQVSFSLGDGFYYFGFVVMFFLALDIFNLDKQLQDHALQKKIVSSALKNIGKEKNALKGTLPDIKNKLNLYSALSSVIAVLAFVWAVWGIIFYERAMFISLFSISIISSIIVAPLKDLKYIRIIFIAEIITNILVIAAIIINHFIF